MSAPGRSAPAAPDWLRQVPLAHRGLHGAGVPENSLAAFGAAVEAGYGVELDVQLAHDGVPVVAHDPSLERVLGVEARVEDLTSAQLAELAGDHAAGVVPTLSAALARLRDVPVMVELKQFSLHAGALERCTAQLLDGHPGPWCVAGFNPVSLRWFRRRRPDAVRVLTAGPLASVPVPAALRRRLARLRDLSAVAPHAVSYELAALPTPATDAWRAAGGALVAWTAADAEALQRARRLADNVIFEGVRP